MSLSQTNRFLFCPVALKLHTLRLKPEKQKANISQICHHSLSLIKPVNSKKENLERKLISTLLSIFVEEQRTKYWLMKLDYCTYRFFFLTFSDLSWLSFVQLIPIICGVTLFGTLFKTLIVASYWAIQLSLCDFLHATIQCQKLWWNGPSTTVNLGIILSNTVQQTLINFLLQ